jgi:hypothetical protein
VIERYLTVLKGYVHQQAWLKANMVKQYVLNKALGFVREFMHEWLGVVYQKNWDDKEDPREGVVLKKWGSKRKKIAWFWNETCDLVFVEYYSCNGTMDSVKIQLPIISSTFF